MRYYVYLIVIGFIFSSFILMNDLKNLKRSTIEYNKVYLSGTHTVYALVEIDGSFELKMFRDWRKPIKYVTDGRKVITCQGSGRYGKYTDVTVHLNKLEDVLPGTVHHGKGRSSQLKEIK